MPPCPDVDRVKFIVAFEIKFEIKIKICIMHLVERMRHIEVLVQPINKRTNARMNQRKVDNTVGVPTQTMGTTLACRGRC